MGSRRKYSENSKWEVGQLANQAGVSVTQVARDLVIQPNIRIPLRARPLIDG